MIKPQEIRDNILVQLLSPPNPIKLPTGIIKVVKLMDSEFKLYNIDKPVCSQEMGIMLDIKMITGIPITKEWLLKNCAYGRDYGKTEELHRFDFAYKDGTPFVTYWSKELKKLLYGRNLDQEIDFIHELQNIFYWNENRKEELTIKE